MRESIGHYRILDRMGGSSAGDVYRARDTRAGRTVALRVLGDEVARDPGRRRRFLADARAASGVSHPNIAALFDVGEDQGLVYLASEYVPGDTLRTVIGGRPINPRRAVDLAVQVADALAEAHAHGMAHGDLRPETIVVTQKGSAKLMEPGFAAWLDEARNPASASTESSARVDIAALGAVLVEMLTGSSPEARPSSARPESAPSGRGWPSSIDDVVSRMTSDVRGDRFTSAALAAAALRSLADELAARSPAAGRPPQRAEPRRSGMPWLLAVLALLALAALIWLATRS